MKLHFLDNPIFRDLKQELVDKYPAVEVFPLSQMPASSDNKTIFIDENLEPNQVVSEIIGKGIRHLVQKNEGRFENDLSAAGKIVDNSEQYFESDFCLFNGATLESVSLKFKQAADKQNLKDAAMAFVNEIGSDSVTQAAEAIIEELYMNAVIDAPREAQKNNWVLSESPCELFLAKTDKVLQISCLDYFGSLDVNKVFRRMAEVYEKGAGQAINLNTGSGAGIGCILLFENSSGMVFGVKLKEKTKVTCLVPIGISNRQRAQMKKSLHWFSF